MNAKRYNIISLLFCINKKKKIQNMPRKIITNEIKDEIIEFYLSYPMTLKTVSERFDICIPTVIKILKIRQNTKRL